MLLPTTTTLATAARRTLTATKTTTTTTTTTMPHRLRATCPRATRIASVRGLHASARTLGATKEDHMDREKLNPTSSEYSKTGTDDDAAKMGDAAFNPNKTRPEDELATADRESGEVRNNSSSQDPNPLDVSPGNKDVSASKDPQEGGPDRSPAESEGSSTRARTSSRGSPKKHGSDKSGGGGVPGTA